MDVAVIGTGFIGGILGRRLSAAGHAVHFGSRSPDSDGVAVGDDSATVTSIGEAIAASEVVILAVPGSAVAEITGDHLEALSDRLVIDATNKMGEPVPNARAELIGVSRYARAFNTTGGENMEDPAFREGVADMFFSAPEADRNTVETLVEGLGMRPVYLGQDREELVDSIFTLWIHLAFDAGFGRRISLKLLDS